MLSSKCDQVIKWPRGRDPKLKGAASPARPSGPRLSKESDASHSLSQREGEKLLKPHPRPTENSEDKADGDGAGFISIPRGREAEEIVGTHRGRVQHPLQRAAARGRVQVPAMLAFTELQEATAL